MSFGHCCFFYIAAASAALPLFTFARLSFTILLAPFLRFSAPCPCVFVRLLCSSLLVQALLVSLFPSVSPCSDAFCAALTFYFFCAQFSAHLSLPNKSRCPCPHSACAISLSRHFYVFALFLAKERKCKREFLHFYRKNILFMVYFYQIYLGV